MREFRCDVFSAEQLRELLGAPLPLGLDATAPERELFRDLYLDTPDDDLRRRGVTCRLRIGADDRRTLSLRIASSGNGRRGDAPLRFDAGVRSAEARTALAEDTSPARRLRALVDPALLEVRLELEVERYVRRAQRDWLRRPRLELQYDQLVVRRGSTWRAFQELRVRQARGKDDALAALAAAFERQGLRLVTEHRRERAELVMKWMDEGATATEAMGSDAYETAGASTASAPLAPYTSDSPPPSLDPDLAILAFQERVLSLAEEPRTPLRERLRFLAIVSTNVDEFFMVRVGSAKMNNPDERSPSAGRIGERVRTLMKRQHRALVACLAALGREGVRVRAWRDLTAAQQAELRARFREEVFPALTPLAMTLSPGHPFPRLAHLGLSLALVLPDERGGAPHFVDVELPRGLPRFITVGEDTGGPRGDGGGDVVPLEELLRANLDVLYPEASTADAFCFRVTRAGDLGLDEDAADDLLEAVDAATRRREDNVVVRVEVERGTPPVLRDLILGELRSERIRPGALQHGVVPPPASLSVDDVYEVDGLLDLRGLEELPAVAPLLATRADLMYPAFSGRRALPNGQPVLDLLRERDLFFHHPFDDFEATVGRFFREAAVDPTVVALKATLYRIGDESPVIDALLAAARNGKDVVAFVELKARFDEERNVAWARALEDAGGRVVYGFVGLKNHAKAALVVRREPGGAGPGASDRATLRRAVHIGTGNYNGRSARQYTDLSLLTSNEALAADVADLFNELTGSSRPPRRLTNGALVAPLQLLPEILARIERETMHARAGRPARIRFKLNGLSDPEIVRALYRAAQEGVDIDLIVRGICTLCPGVSGLSDRIRVVSIVGRFLEHSRIYHFANDGEPQYYIGSADLRPRNLRRRVELLVPIGDPAARARLDQILEMYLADATAWELRPDGTYVRREGSAGAQDAFMRAEGGGGRGESGRKSGEWPAPNA